MEMGTGADCYCAELQPYMAETLTLYNKLPTPSEKKVYFFRKHQQKHRKSEDTSTPKIRLLILPSSCDTFPCKSVMRTWCYLTTICQRHVIIF